MYPTLGIIPFFGSELRSYHLMRWSYFLLAILVTTYLNRRQGTTSRQTVGPFLVGIPAAMIGGHLLNVFEAWPFYSAQPSRIVDVFSGGNSIYGALGVGIGVGIIYLRWQNLPMRAFLDAAAPAMALGEAMTRVGCFLNGCCYGRPTDTIVGVTFPQGSQPFIAHAAQGLIELSDPRSLPVHPTQLYSALIGFVLFILLIFLFMRPHYPGALFCVFLVGYGLQRLVVGHWRADVALYWWEVSQPLSIAIVIVGLMSFWIWHPRIDAADDVHVSARMRPTDP